MGHLEVNLYKEKGQANVAYLVTLRTHRIMQRRLRTVRERPFLATNVIFGRVRVLSTSLYWQLVGKTIQKNTNSSYDFGKQGMYLLTLILRKSKRKT